MHCGTAAMYLVLLKELQYEGDSAAVDPNKQVDAGQ